MLVSVYFGDMFCLILQRIIRQATHKPQEWAPFPGSSSVDVDANPHSECLNLSISTVMFLKPTEASMKFKMTPEFPTKTPRNSKSINVTLNSKLDFWSAV